jgi:hypothetical protein
LTLKVRANVIAGDLIHRFDPGEVSFFNINTPADLAQTLLIQQREQERRTVHDSCGVA